MEEGWSGTKRKSVGPSLAPTWINYGLLSQQCYVQTSLVEFGTILLRLKVQTSLKWKVARDDCSFASLSLSEADTDLKLLNLRILFPISLWLHKKLHWKGSMIQARLRTFNPRLIPCIPKIWMKASRFKLPPQI